MSIKTERIDAMTEENRKLKEALKGAMIVCEVAQKERDEWKARCQAAERDMGHMIPCQTCRHTAGESDECNACAANIYNGWRRSNYAWRGPCGENSGAE